MQQRANTNNALLGLLSIAPMSGYDIRQLIPKSIGHFWNESYGQIYPALKRMTSSGLIEKKTQRTKGKPDRHEYSLTDAGRAQLQDWLKVPVAQRSVVRNELLLKLFFGAQVPPAISREHVEAALIDAERTLKVYTVTEKELRRTLPNDPQLPFWLITLSLGRHDSRAKIAWCKETLAVLGQMAATHRNEPVMKKTRKAK